MKIEEVFRKLKPIAEKDMDLLWQEYILADTRTRKSIEEALHIIMAENLDETYEERNILLEPPPREMASGDYPLGFVFYGKDRFHPFGLREEEWIQHVGIFGRSGSGKTNVAFIIVLNLLRKNKPFLIFDWKRNYRDLRSIIPRREILVFTVGRSVSPFYFNPLIPPAGSPPKIWLKKIIEIMAHAYFLGEGVSYLLQKAIDSVYREFGVYEGNPGIYPNLSDVKSWLENYRVKGREASWMESALRAVGVLCFGEVGNVLNQRVNLPMIEFLKKNVILELDALTNSDKTFLIESLLLWIHHYRMAEGKRERLKHIIMIEEAHHILLRRKQEIMGEEAVTDIILREIRELGESIILIDQHPSLISKPALGNTYCTIAMNLKHRSDIAMISDCMLLDTKKTRYLGKLEIGTGMVKLQGRWFEPFLVRFPLVKVSKGSMSDAIIKELMAEFYQDNLSDLEEMNTFKSQEKEGEFFRDFRSREKEEKTEAKNLPEETDSPPQGEILMLKDVVKHRFSSTSERYRRLGLNAYQGNKIRVALVDKGLIQIKDLPVRKGRVKIFELTDKGKEMLRGVGIDVNISHRKGGFEHEYWKTRVAEHFRKKGYRVIEEYPIGEGKAVDLVAMNDKERIAIEIETGKSDAVYNIQKDLKTGFKVIFCLVLNEKIKQKIEEMISNLAMNNSQIKIMEISRFMNDES
ncbi:MAG: ATP-binding protein [Candidatus Lokiarchaeia archaeon]